MHRPRYDDWTFPKGKLIDGEDDETAALREVEEETGLRCRIGRHVGAVTYLDSRGRPKVVRCFEMLPDGGAFAPTDEVDALRWVPVDEAGEALSLRARSPPAPAGAVDGAGLRRVRGPARQGGQTRGDGRAGRGAAAHDAGPPPGAPARRAVRGLEVDRILSSPFVRCVQTVEPLAEARGLDVEATGELAERTDLDEALALLGSLDHRPTVICGHGAEIRARRSARVLRRDRGGDRAIAKGSVWVLEREDGAFVSARASPRPARSDRSATAVPGPARRCATGSNPIRR